MAEKIKYYTGIFHAQFQTEKAKNVHAFLNSANIILQPRFILENAVEIDAESYKAATLNPVAPFFQKAVHGRVELCFSSNDAKNVWLKEVTLNWSQEDFIGREIWTFIAEKDGLRHGRVKAFGIIAISEKIDDVEVPKTPDIIQLDPIKKESSSTTTIIDPIIKEPSLTPGGCAPLLGLRGGLSSGCLRPGCGLFSLIALAFLLVGLFRQCQGGGQGSGRSSSGSNDNVIHDTVYVDRVQERVDTLFLFQSDTVKLVDSTSLTIFKPVVLPNVQFYTNSANLIPSSLGDIQQLAQHLVDTPELNAQVIGHTDSIGNAIQNKMLSQRRAETVRNVIISMGVESERLEAIGRGESEPKADNGNEEGRLMNRRVEVQLVQSAIKKSKTELKK
jgi:outer membrane protein OmpA-like peptidoglycan-associated protein